ncbi:hypothetical protein Cgig2_028213 [Carnegiea gigantea]|uniref:Uncharacterized protein n=1 Tax=Carnegiea gigantea TaxID=171969 RepID=A0A9Q1JMU3_9CARY|nr:hypothetical protein Cgig2_028213 [Carnegiea gigantea]
MGDVQRTNNGQEGHIRSANSEREMLDKLKIKLKKVKEFINQMSPAGLHQLIQNLNNKQKECMQDIDFEGFLHLRADIILEKIALGMVRNFDTCSCSLLLANGRMRLPEHDVHVTLGLPMCPLEWPKHDSIPKCRELIEIIQGQADRGENFKRNFVMFVVSTCLHGNQSGEVNYMILNARGYLEDTLDKTSMTDEEEQLMKRNIIAKVLKMKVRYHILLTISIGCFHQALFRDGRAAIDLIITNIRLLAELITELEDLIPRADTPLKRVRKVATESMSDALTRDRP